MRDLLRNTAATIAITMAVIGAGPCTAGEPVAPPSSVPAEAFFNFEEMSEPVISPDGDAVAILIRNKSGRRQLAVVDTADLRKVTIAASFSDVDITQVHWADDQRLVFSTWHEESSADDQRGSGLYAVDRTGDSLRELINPRFPHGVSELGGHIKSRALSPDYQLLRTLADGSGDVIIEHFLGKVSGSAGRFHVETTSVFPLRLDTRTGLVRQILTDKPAADILEWVFDDQGRALMAAKRAGGDTTLFMPNASGQWAERVSFPTYIPDPRSYVVYGAGADGRIYARHDHAGATALYRVDASTGQLEADPLVSIQGFDFQGRLVEDSRDHKVLGVHYVSDAKGTAWFDPTMAALQAKVDAKLPGLANVLDPARCGCAKRVLVSSHSDHQPPLFFLYDRTDDTLVQIGNSRPAIDARQMARTDFVRIKARDGQELPVYVTKPHGKGPWPTVVLVHGGPFVRGWQWQWDGESQFLASRGYLVVKPEFRGSRGYGRTLFLSGFKQWGLASQDDIADATTWAAREGLADPKRTCIAGASYGGYATLMGLVRYGDLYRCGVAWSAVADIDLMYDIWWSDASDEWKGYGMPVMVGDRVKDAAQFTETSPLKQAARIRRPLLLAHGGVDRRVPNVHAFQLRDALLDNHAPLTWVYYPSEAHGWYEPQTRADFYRKMETFLDANIGAGSTVETTSTAAPTDPTITATTR